MKVRNEKYKDVNLQQILVSVNKDYVRRKDIYSVFIYLFIYFSRCLHIQHQSYKCYMRKYKIILSYSKKYATRVISPPIEFLHWGEFTPAFWMLDSEARGIFLDLD